MRSSLTFVLTLFLLALPALPVAAQQSDTIWACVDEQGHKTFQNLGTGRGCRRIDGLIATIPGPAPSASGSTRSAAGVDGRGVSPASFPRVDRDTQRLRDSDRRRILEDELRAEEDRLARLRGDFHNRRPRALGCAIARSPAYRERVQRLLEDIQRSEGYIASLKRELTPQRY